MKRVKGTSKATVSAAKEISTDAVWQKFEFVCVKVVSISKEREQIFCSLPSDPGQMELTLVELRSHSKIQ